MMMLPRIAVIAAHPDDELLGVGGVVRNYADQGYEVNCLILGEGITSRSKNREDAEANEISDLHQNVFEAGRILGFRQIELAKLPDNRFDSVALLDVIKIVESFIEKYQPEIIYTHHEGDTNMDHQVTFKAVLTATRPFAGQYHRVRELYTFETPSSTEWNFGTPNYFQPNVFIDISDSIDRKLEAMSCYKSEIREFPYPRSIEALRTISARWGIVCGFTYAEAFRLIRKISVMGTN